MLRSSPGGPSALPVATGLHHPLPDVGALHPRPPCARHSRMPHTSGLPSGRFGANSVVVLVSHYSDGHAGGDTATWH